MHDPSAILGEATHDMLNKVIVVMRALQVKYHFPFDKLFIVHTRSSPKSIHTCL